MTPPIFWSGEQFVERVEAISCGNSWLTGVRSSHDFVEASLLDGLTLGWWFSQSYP
ncbi:MAG: hypothetical protein OXE84_12695 [Rhodobacteraceae bacterium]|nr:hypothetical protein [Paracoccaceae bacterium]MCY4196555.1 hypothetical protein [Paracoccaceae bacterium]